MNTGTIFRNQGNVRLIDNTEMRRTKGVAMEQQMRGVLQVGLLCRYVVSGFYGCFYSYCV